LARSVEVDVTLSEQGGVRYLHFGTDWVQGAMRIAKPLKLEIDYCKNMMAWLLFLAPPKRLLQLGLGAAALTKFVLHHCPHTQLDVIEISADVIDICHAAFALPVQHPNLSLYVRDAQRYVALNSAKGAYAVIQVDLYDLNAQGPVCDSQAFYHHLRAACDPTGAVVVVNLFGAHESTPRNLSRMNKAFAGRVVCLPAVEDGNVIAMAFVGPQFSQTWSDLRSRAKTIAALYGLNAQLWVKGLQSTLPLDLTARSLCQI
jgi:spermidine synthase